MINRVTPHDAPENDDRPLGSVDARFTLAAERTVLAWIRTSLGLVAAGVAVLHVIDRFGEPGTRQVLGVTLIAVGALTAVLGGWRWRRTTTALRSGGDMPGGGAVWVVIAAIVVLAAAFAVVSLLGDGG
ncbi:MAG: DUF202 domain-containing protein [Williamsia sp.]|nr:DUF202 domain-containing protein [Williamsia sp.]MBJ7287369.1 DUF202 domain-containing protein [Williamsia sp.]